ncbi:MAG TPA: MFS transporter [Polyangiaceae bacterium]|nr:MFS transporter [Polyangiaceae bacterium]
MTSSPNKKIRLPAAVIALGFTSLFTDLGAEMIYPLLPAFVASLGAGPIFLGLVEGLADATASLLKLASGFAADKTRHKKSWVLFGYGLAALVRPLVAFATAPWHVLFVRVTDRIGKGLRSSPRDALIAAVVVEESAGRAFGFHQAMDHAGAVIGPLLATALLSLGLPMRVVFFVSIIPGALSVLSALPVKEPAKEPAPVSQPAAATTRLQPAAVLPRSLQVYLLILVVFSLGSSSDVFLLLRAKELGIPVASIALLWAAFHVVKLISSYVGGNWSDRIARTKVIVAGWLIYAATYLGFGLARESWHIWALFAVYGLFYGLTEPVEKALVRDLAPAEIRGRAYGWYNSIIGFTAVPAGLITGWLWQQLGPLVALATGAGLALAASIALIAWEYARPKQTST